MRSVNVSDTHATIGSKVNVEALIDLGDLSPDEVLVQLYYGKLNTRGEIDGFSGEAIDMKVAKNGNDGNVHTFKGTVTYTESGDRGISVRVVPQHKFLTTPFQSNLITWA